jgi:NAD(P)-dependent dehydrogenase (short-subunit alcohol dehydrogenase family)
MPSVTPTIAHNLTGKIALISGGNRNIGRETALRLAGQGADIVITYREQKDSAAQTVKDLQALGVRAAAFQVNLTGTAQLPAFVAQFKKQLADWGRKDFDILINNAGTLRIATFDKVTEDDLDTVFNTNYKSVFFLTQHLAGLMADNGRIVNLGSGTARIAFGPLVSYGPIKAALQSLTLYLASFLGKRGITVNAVAPGGLDDDFNAPLFAMMPAKDYITANTAVARIGVPKDVAGVVAFLCSPDASFVSGAVINIDGGYHL